MGIILLFVGVTIAPAIAQDNEKSQSTSGGKWLYVGGSGPGNYTRIQDALDVALQHDTVFVFAGLYEENILIKGPFITLLGENRDTTIIDANGNGSVITLTWYNTYISGFTLQNSGRRDAGITWIAHTCDNNTIIGNKIINNMDGIFLEWSPNNTIKNNIITQNKRYGISFIWSNFVSIENNEITYNNIGIRLSYSYQCKIIKNQLHRNTYGIDLDNSISYDISENTISNTSDVGINLYLSYNNSISSNNFINNNKDIDFFYDYQNNPTENYFSRNYWDRFRIRPKVIIGSKIVFFIPIFDSNYAIPIIIPWVNCDWHPAKKSNNIHRTG